MIPPNQQMQQAAAMRQMLQKPQDPLLQALSHQAIMGEVLKATADHKMKMLKLKQKYQSQMAPQSAPQPAPQPGQGY